MEILRKLPENCPNLSNAEVAVRPVRGHPQFWETLDEVDYMRPDGEVVVVHKGFVTDFASVPRALWSVLPPFGMYTAAAVIHDFEYFRQIRPRPEADQIFLEAMIELNVRRWKRASMYRAVRMFGDRPWRNKATSEQQNLNG